MDGRQYQSSGSQPYGIHPSGSSPRGAQPQGAPTQGVQPYSTQFCGIHTSCATYCPRAIRASQDSSHAAGHAEASSAHADLPVVKESRKQWRWSVPSSGSVHSAIPRQHFRPVLVAGQQCTIYRHKRAHRCPPTIACRCGRRNHPRHGPGPRKRHGGPERADGHGELSRAIHRTAAKRFPQRVTLGEYKLLEPVSRTDVSQSVLGDSQSRRLD